jgi:UDP-N-acetylglucosamine diphosphorylase/glucosamine-1-phosphate N-acetyltransferase
MVNTEDRLAAVILAAGMGTRMKSSKAKVLHEIIGKPMILHVIESAQKIAGENIVVVIGHQADEVKKAVSERFKVHYALQEKQLGTGHAVQCGISKIPQNTEHVIILCGDVPMISAKTLSMFVREHLHLQRDVTVMAVNMQDSTGYGRVVFDENGNLAAIIEEADATEEQKKIKSINTGIYCVKYNCLSEILKEIKADNAQGEYYLTDIISIGRHLKKSLGAVIGPDFEEVMGINTIEQLKDVEKMMLAKAGKKS